jgi:hypothetical protein
VSIVQKILICGIGATFIALAAALAGAPDVPLVGGLTSRELREIRRVVSRAELSMEQWEKGTPLWRRIRSWPTVTRIRMRNRIVDITHEPDGSVTVRSVSGLWGQRDLRLEKRNGHWCYLGLIEPNPPIQLLSLPPNYRAALDAGRALCFHIGRQWPGAGERGC